MKRRGKSKSPRKPAAKKSKGKPAAKPTRRALSPRTIRERLGFPASDQPLSSMERHRALTEGLLKARKVPKPRRKGARTKKRSFDLQTPGWMGGISRLEWLRLRGYKIQDKRTPKTMERTIGRFLSTLTKLLETRYPGAMYPERSTYANLDGSAKGSLVLGHTLQDSYGTTRFLNVFFDMISKAGDTTRAADKGKTKGLEGCFWQVGLIFDGLDDPELLRMTYRVFKGNPGIMMRARSWFMGRSVGPMRDKAIEMARTMWQRHKARPIYYHVNVYWNKYHRQPFSMMEKVENILFARPKTAAEVERYREELARVLTSAMRREGTREVVALRTLRQALRGTLLDIGAYDEGSRTRGRRRRR